MAGKAEIEQKTEELVTPIIDENHFELVDVEYVKRVPTGICGFTRIKREASVSMTVC